MVKRVIALLALVSFGAAFVAAVFGGVPAGERMLRALAALLAGGLLGWPLGRALERVVLARLSEDWPADGEEAEA